jgi:hypothetical protein
MAWGQVLAHFSISTVSCVTISLVKYIDLFPLDVTVDMAYVVFHFQVNLVALIAHDNQPKHNVMTPFLSLMVHVSIEMKWCLP